MKVEPQPPPPLDPDSARTALRRFNAVNQERLRRAREALPREKRIFLDLLPLLFHINDVHLPGFVSELAPAGLPYYRPAKSLLDQLHGLYKGFTYQARAQLAYRIDALYLMGSVGSVAQSEKSDFDIWLCHRADLEPRDMEALLRKSWAIEKWAASLGIEAHIFMVEPEGFRAGSHGTVTEESSGSAQHHLLLDEFYRTGILVAGRYPVWWLVPPEHERHYGRAVAEILARGLAEREEFLDLGGLEEVPPGEFYGATLWQLYKGIDSPYKSLLKILVMEGYAATYPGTRFLSQRLKEAIYAGETNADHLDPYVQMLAMIAEHLEGDAERLELARRAFYYKVGESLTGSRRGNEGEVRLARMMELTGEWGWSTEHVGQLDDRPAWKAERVMEERGALVGAFTRSYRVLSEFGRNNAAAMTIDAADLTLLGRKLQSAFERKAGKVEFINPGISSALEEPELSVHLTPRGGWGLHHGRVNEQQVAGQRAIKQFRSLLELLAWGHFNGVIGERSELHFHPRDKAPREREVKAILRYLRDTFPGGDAPGGGMEELRAAPRIVAAALFVNVAKDPLAARAARGVQLSDSNTDPLSYGTEEENQVLACDLLMVTSWHEVLVHHYSGATALLDSLGDYFSHSPPGHRDPPPLPEIHSYSSARSEVIARRVETVTGELFDFFYREACAEGARYVLRMGRAFYLLRFLGEALGYHPIDSREKLTARLAEPHGEFSAVRFDPQALTDDPLPLICARNRPERVQLFFLPSGDRAQVWVVDEMGSIFQQQLEFRSAEALLGHFERFFFSVLPRRRYTQREGMTPLTEEVEFCRLHFGEGQWHAAPVAAPKGELERRYINLQVIAERAESGASLFTIYCDQREFSSLEYGEGLFRAVAAHLLSLRRGGERYPFYITDIDVTQILARDAGGDVQTLHFLNYKRRIEERLNEELRQLP